MHWSVFLWPLAKGNTQVFGMRQAILSEIRLKNAIDFILPKNYGSFALVLRSESFVKRKNRKQVYNKQQGFEGCVLLNFWKRIRNKATSCQLNVECKTVKLIVHCSAWGLLNWYPTFWCEIKPTLHQCLPLTQNVCFSLL